MRVQGTCIILFVAVPKARAWHLAQRPEYKPAREKSSRNRQVLRGTVHPPWDTLVKAAAACLHIWARRPSDGRELIGGCLCMRRLLIWRRDLARPWKAKALETPPDMQRPRSTRGPSSPSSAQLPQLPHNIFAFGLGRQGGTSCPITPSRPSPQSRAGHGGKVFGSSAAHPRTCAHPLAKVTELLANGNANVVISLAISAPPLHPADSFVGSK